METIKKFWTHGLASFVAAILTLIIANNTGLPAPVVGPMLNTALNATVVEPTAKVLLLASDATTTHLAMDATILHD